MYEYIFENGNYILVFDNERYISGPSVAIAFDREEGTLMKHGKPEFVNAYAIKTRQRLARIDQAMAESVVVIEGPFALEELNKCISISGYVGHFYHSLCEEKKGGIVDVTV